MSGRLCELTLRSKSLRRCHVLRMHATSQRTCSWLGRNGWAWSRTRVTPVVSFPGSFKVAGLITTRDQPFSCHKAATSLLVQFWGT